jgi:hypothetical protein
LAADRVWLGDRGIVVGAGRLALVN